MRLSIKDLPEDPSSADSVQAALLFHRDIDGYDDKPSLLWLTGRARTQLNRGGPQLVAKDGDVVVGALSAEKDSKNSRIRIIELATSGAEGGRYRGCGIATKLIARAAAYAIEVEMEVEIIMASAEGAPLYEKLGFGRVLDGSLPLRVAASVLLENCGIELARHLADTQPAPE